MTVRIFRSTDASAPTLSGTAGTLCTVLDAVLVNGYGSTSAAGWTIAYTGTNKRQYAPQAGGTGCQLFIDDAAPGAAGAKEARFCGFKTGTGLGTGTGQFPSTGQQSAPSGALVIRKSTTADSTARAWTIIADGNTVYMFIETGDLTAPLMAYPWMFGDFFSYNSSDTNNSMIIGRRSENVNYSGTSNISGSSSWQNAGSQLCDATAGIVLFSANSIPLSETIPGHYVAGGFNGVGGSTAFGKHTHVFPMGAASGHLAGAVGYLGTVNSPTTSMYPGANPYPNATDGGLHIAPIWIHHNNSIRGYLKGLWAPLHHVPLSHGDTYNGAANLSGKSFIALNVINRFNYSSTSITDHTPAQFHVEYSDTWN